MASRYQIALGLPKSSIFGYCFKPTKSVKRVLSFMKQCIQDEKEMFIVGVAESTLSMAMVLLSQEEDVPILVNSESEARSMSVAYSHKRIYYKDNFPSIYSYAIFHPDVDRKFVGNSIKPFLLINRARYG